MKLKDLKIKSFVTAVDRNEKMQGGIAEPPTGPLQCPTSPTSPERGCC